MELKEGLKLYKDLPRDEYFEKNQELASRLWNEENLPTVLDIADFVKDNKVSDRLQNIFDFLDNKDDFTAMATRRKHLYDQEESSSFIRKVMSANNKEISESGYFYKLLMESADDLIITQETCNSHGRMYDLKNSGFSEEDFNYYINALHCTEINEIVDCTYHEFLDRYKETLEKHDYKIHILSPLTCECLKTRGLCRRCCGKMPTKTKNVGTFTTLMVTESATQSALSSMNKGRKENINQMLTQRYDGAYDLAPIKAWIASVVGDLQNDNVSSRFYELALISRIKFDKTDTEYQYPYIASLKSSIQFSGNLFGSYIFSPTEKTINKMINEGEFEDSSLKLKIALNKFDPDDNCFFEAKECGCNSACDDLPFPDTEICGNLEEDTEPTKFERFEDTIRS